MKFKILTFDGRPVKTVLYDRIVYNEPDDVTLHAASTTMDQLVRNILWHEPYRTKCEQLLRKCELEEVELRFTKQI